MARVEIELNGRPYAIGCEDGQEGRLREIASFVDSKLRTAASSRGSFSESQRLVLALLTLADQVFDLRADLSKLRTREKPPDRSRDSQASNSAPAPSSSVAAPPSSLPPPPPPPPPVVFAGLDPKTEERYASFIETLAARIDSVASRLARV